MSLFKKLTIKISIYFVIHLQPKKWFLVLSNPKVYEKFQMSQVTCIDEWLWAPKSGEGVVSSVVEKKIRILLADKWEICQKFGIPIYGSDVIMEFWNWHMLEFHIFSTISENFMFEFHDNAEMWCLKLGIFPYIFLILQPNRIVAFFT